MTTAAERASDGATPGRAPTPNARHVASPARRREASAHGDGGTTAGDDASRREAPPATPPRPFVFTSPRGSARRPTGVRAALDDEGEAGVRTPNAGPRAGPAAAGADGPSVPSPSQVAFGSARPQRPRSSLVTQSSHIPSIGSHGEVAGVF